MLNSMSYLIMTKNSAMDTLCFWRKTREGWFAAQPHQSQEFPLLRGSRHNSKMLQQCAA